MHAEAFDMEKNEIKKTGVRAIIGMIIFAAVGAAALLADLNGFGIIMLNERNSLMRFIMLTAFSVGMYFFITLLTAARIGVKKGTNIDVVMLKGFYKVLCGISIIIGVFSVFGMIDSVGSVLSQYGSMMLGWSLQAPVSGIAAWIMIIITRPYKIGDRVSFPQYGLMGDVVKFNPMYLTLNQVGGTVGSEEASGRMLNVPNALLFSAMAINCSYQQAGEESAYVLDEALYRITYDSDWDTVEDILISSAREVTADIIKETGQEPYVRADTWDYGTLFRLRYMSASKERPRIMYEIVKISTKKIQANRNVDMAIPYVYSFKRGIEINNSKGKEGAFEKIDIADIDCALIEPPEFFDENKNEILGLIENISRDGLRQPIIVSRNIDGSGRYTLLYGEKRLKACMILGWTQIPAEIKNKVGIDIKAMNKAMTAGDPPAMPPT